jgi:hypothetical protein
MYNIKLYLFLEIEMKNFWRGFATWTCCYYFLSQHFTAQGLTGFAFFGALTLAAMLLGIGDGIIEAIAYGDDA